MGRSDDPTSVSVLKYLLESAVLTKDVSALRVLAGRLVPLAGLLHTQADMAYCIGRLCGGASALLGEADKARGYYQQAIEICEKVRFRPELALSRLEMAELLLAEHTGAMNRAPTAAATDGGSVGARHASPLTPSQAQRAEALAHLDFAIGELRDMKMQPSLERALRHKEVLKA